ncbi:MAG: hypothetical protein OWQ51_09530 [Pyrobaculum arsenaticum]|uniref:Uncharacterized protein n=1 Tax=Pyrobaculum arsenaticum (strain DSM 13514 / JCM 11321 / PZ6) TaxID=340102 RepID=A4WK93_PYRAR|nr:hypothetical protein [Pyrobaculum arsenaticum]ABP50810.1 conserved hypothetical protein [Pyrobaculum arsenaticum DSM 13514]MCY0891195.1 hypothetical protein [Pyrobaculum arsenaticum]
MKAGLVGVVGLIIGIALGALIGGGLSAPEATTVVTTLYQTTTVTTTYTTERLQTLVQTVTVTQTVTQTAAPPALGAQDISLRESLGTLVGRHFLGDFPSVAVVTQPNVLCSALAASALSAMPPYSVARLVVYNTTAPDASASAAAGASAVFLAFGGEEPLPVADKSLRDFLAALAARGYKGSLVVHTRAWAATSQFKTVLNDTRISAWVKGLPIYVVLLNATHVTVARYNATTGALTPVRFIDMKTGEAIKPYTEAESLFLRSTVGRVAGSILFQGYSKVAIVTGMDPACVALSAAAYTASRANSTKIIVYTTPQQLVQEIKAYSPDAVFIAFGGDMPSYAISNATRGVLTALKDAGYRGDVLLHAFVLRATNMLSTVLDAELSQWLSQRNVKGIAPDLANRRVNIVVFRVADGRLQPANVTMSLPMPDAIADVLRRVLSS